MLPRELDALPLHIEHIIARKHNGPTISENLALACFNCNVAKGTNLSGIDPATGIMERLYHPRRDLWSEHFSWNGPEIVGLTSVGRTTVAVLNLNHGIRIRQRQLFLKAGWIP